LLQGSPTEDSPGIGPNPSRGYLGG
jgi:hypothetical protein